MAEDQVSPGMNAAEDYSKINSAGQHDQAASRRILPGTRSEDMHEGPPLIELHEIDSAFQLTEHLKALHASHTRPASFPDTIVPVDRSIARSLAEPPPGVDRGIWLYELCRFLTQKANAIAVGLFTDDPPCSATTCPEMRASEWQYLCAAHDPPKSCCAIDYCCHTLDWAATQLTSSKLFPSRLALGTENVSSNQQLRKMTEIFRRVYRIFAHAWFQHREVFWRVESKTGLYVLFKTVCDEYRLIPEDNYTIPSEAEGIETTPVAQQSQHSQNNITRGEPPQMDSPVGNMTVATGNTTKRHRGLHERQTSVSTIIHEEVEEDDDDANQEEEPQRGVVREVEPEPELSHQKTLTQDTSDEVDHYESATNAFESQTEDMEHEPSTDTNAVVKEQSQGAAGPGEDEPLVKPMDTSKAEAGDGDEATETVAD
ncbi:hypothetical protein MBLNU457_3518t1 [Dothideomycetes sp. NU457]